MWLGTVHSVRCQRGGFKFKVFSSGQWMCVRFCKTSKRFFSFFLRLAKFNEGHILSARQLSAGQTCSVLQHGTVIPPARYIAHPASGLQEMTQSKGVSLSPPPHLHSFSMRCSEFRMHHAAHLCHFFFQHLPNFPPHKQFRISAFSGYKTHCTTLYRETPCTASWNFSNNAPWIAQDGTSC